jgi:hypothetical protein
MLRRLFIATVLIASTAGVAAAQTQATFVMRNGQRISGAMTYKGGSEYTLNGVDYPSDQVAVIAFVPNDPSALELSRLPNVDNNPSELERHVFVPRDGTMVWGKLYKFSPDGNIITFDQREGGRHDIAASDMARIYINPAAARSVYAPILAGSNPSSAAVGTSGATVTVPANQQWVGTGFTVRRGETLHFNTTGDVQWSPDIADNATAAGARTGRRSDGAAPVPAAPGGALVARIDNGKPFLIGNQGSVRMPANGQLFLGVNDSILTDNGGTFVVTISR